MAAVQGLYAKVGNLLSNDQTQFALKVEDFVQLSKYVKVGLALPKSGEDFRSRFPEDKLQNFFARDSGLHAVSLTTCVMFNL